MTDQNIAEQPASDNQNVVHRVPVVAIVLAAGFGTRFNPATPKQLVSLTGKPIVIWSLEAFERNVNITDIIVAVNSQVRSQVETLIEEYGISKVRMIIDGGKERMDSSLASLQTLEQYGVPNNAKILIHDAVRPFVSQEQINNCIAKLDMYDAATVAYRSTDTILLTAIHDNMNQSDDTTVANTDSSSEPCDVSNDAANTNSVHSDNASGDVVVVSVPDREHLYRAQTPQAFRFGVLMQAYSQALQDDHFAPTDDSRVVVDYMPNTPVAIVQGSEQNIKITTYSDLPYAEFLAAQRSKA